MDDDLFRVVPKVHVLELDVTHYLFQFNRVGSICDFLIFIEEFEHSFSGRSGLLEHVRDVGELLDGPSERADILDKRLDVADGNGTPDR